MSPLDLKGLAKLAWMLSVKANVLQCTTASSCTAFHRLVHEMDMQRCVVAQVEGLFLLDRPPNLVSLPEQPQCAQKTCTDALGWDRDGFP